MHWSWCIVQHNLRLCPKQVLIFAKNFIVRDVIAIGDELGLPKELVNKVPSDGLCGKTDEDNLGFTYDFLDSYLSGEQVSDEALVAEIERRHRFNLHKEEPMPAVTIN